MYLYLPPSDYSGEPSYAEVRSLDKYGQYNNPEQVLGQDTDLSTDISETSEISPAHETERNPVERSLEHKVVLSQGDIDPDKLKKENEAEAHDRAVREPQAAQGPEPEPEQEPEEEEGYGM